MQTSIFALIALTLPVPAFAQEVPYEKYVLDNGLTVILHEDHSLPQVCVDIWYHVGAKDEVRGRSGFAHLFEHLMFMGTQRVPGSDFDNIMEAGGGYNNASTSQDRTNYFECGPAELLPTLLWLEADRLEDLGEAMTQEKLDRQRDVVRNERRQSYENRPYGKSYLARSGLLYPEDHPYHIPVIGTHEDLEAAAERDVKSFFSTYYVPNNASLVVAGDFDSEVLKPLIANLFGTLPRGADVVHKDAPPAKLDSEIVHTMTDSVQFARVSLVWHSPRLFGPGDAEMDLLGSVLSEGIASRLYQKLVVEANLAIGVEAYQSSGMLGSTFEISATARPGVELEAIEAAIDEVLADLLRNGVTENELERQKAQLEHQALAGLQSIRRKADDLNKYEFHFGEPDSFARDLDRYRSVTPAGLKEWAARVIVPERLVLRVVPEIPAPETNPRDERPGPTAVRPFAPALPESFALSNGVQVHVWSKPELPLVELRVLLSSGAVCDVPQKAGLAALCADMLDEGAGDRTAVEFADGLELLGASLRASVARETTSVALGTLGRTFEEALGFAADAILRPRFDEKEWKRVHDLHLQKLQQNLDSPTAVAAAVSMKVFFGADHPYGRPIDGTLETAGAISLDDVRGFHRASYRPSGSVILVAGDITAERAKEALERAFGSWSDPADVSSPVAARASIPEREALRVVYVDRPGAVQTVVRFLFPAPAYDHPSRPERTLLTTILGGSFTSRLNQNLREDKGYTYGASARFSADPSVGYLVASSNVRADVTGPSVAEFLKEFGAMATGDVTAVEAGKAYSTTKQRTVESFAGLAGILRAAEAMVVNGRPFTGIADDLAAMSALTEVELNALAREVTPLSDALLVLVGDERTLLEQLHGLNLPDPVQLDEKGNPVRE